MLTIEEAEKFATEFRDKAWRGEKAINALRWLEGMTDPVNLQVSSHHGSGCHGYKEAMEYINVVFRRTVFEAVKQAKRDAQTDMDMLGPSKQ